MLSGWLSPERIEVKRRLASLEADDISLHALVADLQHDLYVGVAYNVATDTWRRLGKAQGLTAGAWPGAWISPIFQRLRRVVLTDAGVVYKGISWLDMTKHDDGTDVALGGANGQIMVEMSPSYYKVGVHGNWKYVLISHLPLSGFSLFPLFTGMSAVYVGAYEASLYDAKLCSVAKSPADGSSAVYPVTTRAGAWGHAGLTTAVTDTLAHARGNGWQSSDLLSRIWYRILLLVGFASFDIPGIVGAGRINLSGGTWDNDSYIGKCGLGDATGGWYSAVQNGSTAGYLTDYAQVLGVENPWGNVWERVNSLVSDGALYYMPSAVNPTYDYTAITGWTRLLDALGNAITLPTSEGYCGVPHSGLGMVLPSDVTGSSSTKMRDYYYYASSLRVLLVGGYSSNGTTAGPFYWYAYYAASGASSNVGGRLCFKKAA